MAIKAISQFPLGEPKDNDYILFEQNGEGKSAKFGDFSLSYEKIMTTNPAPDLSGKVASADALKTLGDGSYCEHVVTESSGEYWRFASGLQICLLYKYLGSPTFGSWGSLYDYYVPLTSFPAPFVEAPFVAVVSAAELSVMGGVHGDASPSTTAWSNMLLIRATPSNYPVYVRLIAIGRWK